LNLINRWKITCFRVAKSAKMGHLHKIKRLRPSPKNTFWVLSLYRPSKWLLKPKRTSVLRKLTSSASEGSDVVIFVQTEEWHILGNAWQSCFIKDHKGIFEKEWKQVFDTSSFGAFGCFKRCNLCTGIWPARVLEATASSMTRWRVTTSPLCQGGQWSSTPRMLEWPSLQW
jgi:hypothetical protein